jgi:hypothetical protein
LKDGAVEAIVKLDGIVKKRPEGTWSGIATIADGGALNTIEKGEIWKKR